jgi:NarL family two-component system response regulator LiaR
MDQTSGEGIMETHNPIRVMIVDDHTVVRSGLTAVLLSFDDLEMVGEAGSGEEALTKCVELNPDVVLMDLVMPGMDGATATKAIMEKCPHVRIIALTSFKERDLVEGALKAGAISYLLKNVSAEELTGTIREAVAGRPKLSPEAVEALIQGVREPQPQSYDLTDREIEILTLMVQGLSNNEIAKRLFVSRSTIKFHVSNILSKLVVTSRTEAVALAIKKHLVT